VVDEEVRDVDDVPECDDEVKVEATVYEFAENFDDASDDFFTHHEFVATGPWSNFTFTINWQD